MFRATTVAPEITAPEASVTVPTILEVMDCDSSTAVKKKNAKQNFALCI
jgi:hypothetical protein